jgi:hypothetical protein
MLRGLMRWLTGPTHQLDGAAFVLYWQIQAQKIGASMDALARGLR